MASERVSGPADHLSWQSVTVRDRPALYGVAGEGIPLLFLHGWGLAHHAYKRPLKRLVHLGCRVYAPAMPGFGGTADLPKSSLTLAGYAAWVGEFLDAVGVTEPLIVVGHSFGGGVAIQVAHDLPERVRSLVLVNSIGGSVWSGAGSTARKMAQRPLWDWGIHFPSDLLPVPQITKVLPVVLEDALPNVVSVASVARSMEGKAKRRGGLFGLSRSRPRLLRTLTGAKPADEANEGEEAVEPAEDAS